MSSAADTRQNRITSRQDVAEALVQAERLRSEGRRDEAEQLCRQVLAAAPDQPEALHLLGILLHLAGKTSEAIDQIKRATRHAPDNALYHANLGEMWRLAGRADLALEQGKRALALKPDYPEALSNIGIAHYELKQYADAAECYRRALAINPAFAQAHSNLGNALHALRRFDEAVASYRRAVELAPEFADGWSNLGTTLHHSGQYDAAMVALRRAIALDPDNANAQSGLGILLLMRGDFAEGWDEYEWRLKSTEVRLPYIPQRPWQGESLAGRHIYLHAEQGFGDTIQFARYLPLVAARAGAVTFRVQQGLAGLMRQSFDNIDVLGDRGAPARSADCECALLSLPRLFGTRLETIPATVPYLRADPAEAAYWRARRRPAGLHVGIAWAGNPEHVNDHRRSIPLGDLAPLFEVPGVTFVSLQVGGRAEDLSRHPEFGIVDIAPELVGFAATAAAMTALDLVITIDSAVAHLAAALARPTWLMTPCVSDWRWLLGREDNPWYPTMRLFRQAPDESWRAVAERVAAELAVAATGDPAPLTPFRETGEQRAAQTAAILAAAARRPPPPAAALAAPAQLLAVAEQRRRIGKLAEAEMLSRRVLETEPTNAEAFHLIGIIAHQSGNLTHAIEHVRRATALAPEVPLYHANLGEMYRLAGRGDEAIAACRRALALQPDFPDALNNLGICHYERGAYGEALSCYDRAIALRAQFVEAHSNRGNALRAQDRLDDATDAYRRALELRPAFADAWNNLGTTLRDLKRCNEAEAAYRKALALKPDDADTLNNLALALKDLDRLDEAMATLRRSLAIESRNAKTLLYLGTMLLDAHRIEEGADAIARAFALDPGNADIVNAMGRAAFERGELDASLIHYRRALDMKPDLADAYNNMGNALKELGRLEEAQTAFLQSLALDRKATGVYVNFSDGHRFTAGDPQLAAMEELAAQADALGKTDRMQLDFALGKAYADLADYRRSFDHLRRGNAAKRAQIAYDEGATMRLFDDIEATFTPALLATKAGWGDPNETPVFIVGMPRSGTTLIEQILASHPRIHGAGELTAFDDAIRQIRGPDGVAANYPALVPALNRGGARLISENYLAAVTRLAPTAARITDKMPSNFYFLGPIHLALPNARIIHAVRDPIDTCVSCYSKLFTGEQNHTYELAELGRYYRRYERLMAHWRAVLPPGRILETRYETLVADVEGEARRLVAHCGLDWDPRCVEFHRTDRVVRTASVSQVRQPIYRSAVGRWRKYEKFLLPLLTALSPPD